MASLYRLEREVRNRFADALVNPPRERVFEAFRRKAVRGLGRERYNRLLAEQLDRTSVPLVLLHAKEEHLPVLVQALQHKESDVRWAAAITLGKLGKPAAREAVKALENPDAGVRAGVGLALGNLGKWSAPYLAKALRHRKPYVRISAAHALMHMKPQEAAPYAKDLITHGLLHRDAFVRVAAASALGRLGPKTARHLSRVLKHPDPLVRMSAVRALGLIGQDAPREVTVRVGELMRKDSSTLVQQAAKDALEKMRRS